MRAGGGADGPGGGLLRQLLAPIGHGPGGSLAVGGRGLPSRRPSVGLTPCRDWAHEMQQAAATAERVVGVFVRRLSAVGDGEADWWAVYGQDRSGERGLLLPVRVGPGSEPPGLLRLLSMWIWSTRTWPAPRRHCWPQPAKSAVSRLPSRSSPEADGGSRMPPSSRGSSGSCCRCGTCRRAQPVHYWL